MYFFLPLLGYQDGFIINKIKLHCTRNLKGFREVLIIDRTKFKNKIVTYTYILSKNYFIEKQVLTFFSYYPFIYLCNYLGPETHMHLFHRLRNITIYFRKVATGKYETWFMLCFKNYIISSCFYDTNVLYRNLVINEVKSKSFISFTRSFRANTSSRPYIHSKVTR